MKHYYLPVLLVGLAQPVAAQLNTPLATPGTPRPAFRGDLPDSVAALPTPAGTFRLQGQEQPIRPFITIQDQLRTVAGVQVTPYDGSPGSGSVVRIRGASVAQGQGQPLYVVDGLPALNDDLTPNQAFGLSSALTPSASAVGSNSSYNPGIAEQQAEVGASPLQLLPPESIESIEVLAGPAAVARYGPLGANGVVSIRTRRGPASRPLRVHYAAYAGVQQVRHYYDLLPASEYGVLLNEIAATRGGRPPYSPAQLAQLGTGTDWQRETYRAAGLQQHQLSLEGSHAATSYRLSADYRQQSGVLPNQNLHRYGLRLALDQRVGARLTLRGTATLGQTDQRQPIVTTGREPIRAALMAPPTEAVYTAQGTYNGLAGNGTTNFANPLAEADYQYRTPRTRRLLTQLAADYEPLRGLTVQAAASFQRTLLDAESNTYYYRFLNGTTQPSESQPYATQTYRTGQWNARLALRYQRRLGEHHHLAAEVDYQYQRLNAFGGRTDYAFIDRTNPQGASSSGYYELQSEGLRLHRPWASIRYALDSTLEVQASVSYGHYYREDATRFYPSAQVRWHTRPGALAASLWVGAARTSVLALGYGLFGPAVLTTPYQPNTPIGYPYNAQRQAPLYNNQFEAGLQLAPRAGHLRGQLVAYQRTSHHALLSEQVGVPQATGYTTFTQYGEGTIRNQGLELTLAATWQAGQVQGSTSLAASANRNRLQDDEALARLSPRYDNQPVGAFFGLQQDGLTSTGTLRYRDPNGNGRFDYDDEAMLGAGIPAQLLSLSQQLRLGRWGLDAQVDGMFDYQVLNHQLSFLDVPSGSTNNATTVRDRWTPTNQAASVPAAGSGSYLLFTTDRLLENGSHVRLSALTATYRLRQAASSDISLWAGVQNLFVLTGYRGYDPNVSSGGTTPALAGQDYGAVPVPRTWLLGVRASL
jgi:TonB-linked SusC/RagA family outer membrane protein